MPSLPPKTLRVSVIGLSDDGMGHIRASIRTEVQLPPKSVGYESGMDDVVCRQATLVLIGVDTDRVAALRLSQRLLKEDAEIRLIALSESEERVGALEILRAGFSEYLLIPSDSETLRRAIHIARRNEARHLGKLTVILGTKGGCGVSTLTTNLAAELADMHRVCAVDLDFDMGDMSALVGLEPETSIQDLLAQLPTLTQRDILRAVSVHTSKLHVLPQSSFPEDPQHMVHSDLRTSDVHHLLHLLSETYQYVFLDCSGALDFARLGALQLADQIWLICTPDVLSIRNAWRRLRLLDQLGVSRDCIRIVLNRSRPDAPLSDEDIEENLSFRIAARISEDRRTLEQSVTRGVLIREIDSESHALRDLASSVRLVTDKRIPKGTS